MIIAFFICWLPYTTISVVVVVDPEIYIPPLVATMPMYFAKTSPVYNPIIYFLTNKQVCLLCLLWKSVFMFLYSIVLGLLCNETLQSFSEMCLPSFESCLWKSCPVGDTSLVTLVV